MNECQQVSKIWPTVYLSLTLLHFFTCYMDAYWIRLLWHWPLAQTWQSFLPSAGIRSRPRSWPPPDTRGDLWSRSPGVDTGQTSPCSQTFSLQSVRDEAPAPIDQGPPELRRVSCVAPATTRHDEWQQTRCRSEVVEVQQRSGKVKRA